MQPGARLQAAIDVLAEIADRGRPAALTLADWGRSHRFAGAGDRGAIGNLVYDGLRQRQSLAWIMGSDTPRAVALAAMHRGWGYPPAQLAALCDGQGFAPAPLSGEEERALAHGSLDDAPAFVRGDYPEWLQPAFAEAFGDDTAVEGGALARRAPIDLRVNTLKAARDKVLKALSRYDAAPTPASPLGVRLPPRAGSARSPNVEAEPAHGRGWFEVQDEGSQIAGLLAEPGPREQVLDICAGAGGKTLAFAAAMQNTGQIYAYDADPHRFRPIFERLKRAGARNVQTLPPGQIDALFPLAARMDLVLLDAPCSGSGAWRRHPDAKWRLTPGQLATRLDAQRTLLTQAAAAVKPHGSLVYVTCSVLPLENGAQIVAFLAANPGFRAENPDARLKALGLAPHPRNQPGGTLLTPLHHGTDGFYISVLRKA